jgi:predicted GNAT family N-acyltransferase
MKIELKAESDLNEAERLGLERLSAEAFPPDGTDTKWAKNNWHVLVWEADEIVSQVEIIDRVAKVGRESVPATGPHVCCTAQCRQVQVRLGGIGGVSTLKAWRKRGLAEAALKVAMDYIRQPMAVDFGLLICGDALIPYYGKFGWKLVAEEMWIDQPKGKVLFKAHIMVLPVCKQEWPEGEIDLCGRPW